MTTPKRVFCSIDASKNNFESKSNCFFAHQGFTQGESTWLPINESYKTINVEDQSKDETSTLQTYKTIVQIRRAHEDLILWGTTSLFIEVRISAYQFAKLEKVEFGENFRT